MPNIQEYDRESAVRYAHKWAYGRNPAYYDYENIGGDCTNFVSQCIYAGSGVMNYSQPLGWFYSNANNKAPAWTGVPYLYNFLTRKKQTIGPVAELCELQELQPGDIVQLSFSGTIFQHSPIVVSINQPTTLDGILVAAHSIDTDNRPLSTYAYQQVRFLHIMGSIRS